MARLSEKGQSTFVILDHEPLYTSDDVDTICADHNISETHRSALWRTLEEAGRAYLDQRRLGATPTKMARVRQDLRLARQLAAQLAEMSPDKDQLSSDTPGVSLSRAHLSALREGERKAGPACGARLEDLREALTWADSVFEAALDSCGRQDEDPDEAWRIAITNFYTRELARSWAGQGAADGASFMTSCRAPLERNEGAAGPAITAFDLAARS